MLGTWTFSVEEPTGLWTDSRKCIPSFLFACLLSFLSKKKNQHLFLGKEYFFTANNCNICALLSFYYQNSVATCIGQLLSCQFHYRIFIILHFCVLNASITSILVIVKSSKHLYIFKHRISFDWHLVSFHFSYHCVMSYHHQSQIMYFLLTCHSTLSYF